MAKVRRITHSSEEHSSSSSTSSSLSSDEEIDARDLKPIKDYLLDRKELASQLFKSVKPEKIRMMLPQALKKMDFGELEEWCASELSGMSKSRILCIINGKAMVQSSDTSESDDSGPSLEIISDTEEWFTDDDISKTQDGLQSGKMKIKKERIKLKTKSKDRKKNDAELNSTKNGNNKHLLDLIELEMRARAIRALIRKEEDVKPDVSKCKENMNILNENTSTKTPQDELKDKENCRKQLERIITAQHTNIVDDEDVVLVIQPTPTIELLSSDSEGEGHSGRRINKKLQNERVIETEKDDKRVENGNIKDTKHPSTIENLKEKYTQGTREKAAGSNTLEHKVSVPVHKNNVDSKNKQPGEAKPSGKRRKVKKKSRSKEQLKNSTTGESCKLKTNDISKETKNTESVENISVNSVRTIPNNVETNTNDSHNLPDSKVSKDAPLSEMGNVKKQSITNTTLVEEEKSNDLDEIIDLDDYCDDMEDMESNENDKSKIKQVTEKEQAKPQTAVRSTQKSGEAETWASRYYQTDDVQNVIKESKIQSEIRKRLRERQRLSKLNESISRNSPSSSTTTEVVVNETEQNPTGSVDEYLALKRTASVSLSPTSSNNSVNVTQSKNVPNETCTPANAVIVHSHTPVTYSKENSNDTKTTVIDSDTTDTTLLEKDEKVDGTPVNDTNCV